jgi:hypothetical protein
MFSKRYTGDNYVMEIAYCNVHEFITAICQRIANMCYAGTGELGVVMRLRSKEEQSHSEENGGGGGADTTDFLNSDIQEICPNADAEHT